MGIQVNYSVDTRNAPVFRGTDKVKRGLKQATRETLPYGKGVVQQRTPVDTGLLRKSWHYLTDDRVIWNEVHYSAWVEEGTSRMAGRFMARDSLPEISDYYAQMIEKFVVAAVENG